MLGVILGIISPLIATSIMAGVYGRTLPWSLDTAPPPALYAIPVLGVQFALARILYLATYSALAFHEPLTAAALDPRVDEVGVAVAALFLAAAGNAVAAAYLEATLPRRYGTPAHPCFCLPARARRGVSGGRATSERSESPRASQAPNEPRASQASRDASVSEAFMEIGVLGAANGS